LFTITDQINTVHQGFRHVVILGAGASRASCIDNPEKNGKLLPLMNDLPKIINLKDELKDLPSSFKNRNFETIFSKLFDKEPNSERLQRIEQKIYEYFSSLKLPDSPTIYDYLVLSLREKDLIATFNWDPFLWQAFERNQVFTDKLPKMVFLHGNVAIGVCEEYKVFGPVGFKVSDSEIEYKPVKLLYPVEHKNYSSDSYINSQWDFLSFFLESPSRVTIFGYSAPDTDVEAISTMKKAWGTPEKKQFTQFEIIDIQDEAKLKNSWKYFIYSHHYRITNNFYKSSIVSNPRRSGETYKANKIEGRFYELNYPPRFETLEEMWDWYKLRVDKEIENS
jgi:hypothetical protein